MINSHVIGTVTLNISTVLYCLWFLPQLLYNYQHKTTQFNYAMHLILMVGYLMDCLYGFGLHMPWQYKFVTLIGLSSLSIQHIQIFLYGINNKRARMQFILSTIAVTTILVFIILTLTFGHVSHAFLDDIGLISAACWLGFALPQLITQHRKKSLAGISTAFIFLMLTLALLDGISTWTLGWDYPNKISNTMDLIERFFWLGQWFMYSTRGCTWRTKLTLT